MQTSTPPIGRHQQVVDKPLLTPFITNFVEKLAQGTPLSSGITVFFEGMLDSYE